MILINLDTDVTLQKVTAIAMTKSGTVTYKIDEHDEPRILHLPAMMVRPIINSYKTTKFVRGIPLAVLSVKGEVLFVESRQLMTLNTTTEFRHAGDWVSGCDALLTLLARDARENPTLQWYCDGSSIYRDSPTSRSTVLSDGIFVKRGRGINLQKFMNRVISQRHDFALSEIAMMLYDNGKIKTPPVTVTGSTLVLATEYRAEGKQTVIDVLEHQSPTIGHILRSVIGWSEVHGNELLEKLPLTKLLIHYRVTNLYDIPTVVRDAAPSGLSLTHLLAWNLALCYRAQNVRDAAIMQRTLQALVSGGYVDVRKLGVSCLYKAEAMGQIPPKFDINS